MNPDHRIPAHPAGITGDNKAIWATLHGHIPVRMTTRTVGVVAVLAMGLLHGCRKDESRLGLGVYKGTFKVTYTTAAYTGPVSLVLNQGRFICIGTEDRMPPSGEGTYTIGGGKIEFKDEIGRTADFDWNLVLHGVYDYAYDGRKLIISASKNGLGFYEYHLERE